MTGTGSRSRWAAVGAAVAVVLGAGGVSLSQAALEAGERPVLVSIEPCRLVDTRPGSANIGGRTAPLGASDTLTLQVTGSVGECSGVPADAVAAALNVTAIQGSAQSFLSVYPSDAALPNASSLNWGAGAPPTPNKVDVKLGPGGAIKLTNSVGTVHVAVDLVGYTMDHTHDDRYYTQDEVDALVTPASPLLLDAGEFSLSTASDNWSFTDVGWYHASEIVPECIHAPVELPPGATITSASILHETSGGPGSFRIVGRRANAGPTTTHTALSQSGFGPTAGAVNDREWLAVTAADGLVRRGYEYALLVCPEVEFRFMAAQVAFDL